MTRELSSLLARLTHYAGELWNSGPSGAFLLIYSAVAVSSAFVLAAPVLRSRTPPARLAVMLAALPMVAMLASFARLVVLARRDWLPFALQEPGSRVNTKLADPLGLVDLGLLVVVTSVVVIAVVAVAMAVRARTSPMARAVALTFAALVALTAWVALKQSVVYDWNACGDRELMDIAVLEKVTVARQRLADWKQELVIISALGLNACLALGLRETSCGHAIPVRGALGAAVLLGMGVVAFAITRPAAADAYLEFPHVPKASRCMGGALLPPEPIVNCGELPSGPVVEWDAAGRIMLHAGGPDYPGEASSRYELRGQLHSRTRFSRLYHPERKFSGSIGLAAPRNTPMSSLRLSDFHSAGYEHVYLLVRPVPSKLLTRTVGSVPLQSRCCALEMRLNPEGVPTTAFATYGDLLRAQQQATRRNTLLTVAP